MKKKLFTCFLLFILCFFKSSPAFAIEDPTTIPNNKYGIHILFTSELAEAAKLVNSNGGDWGYVTIPIQAGDRDLTKWQDFMDQCKQYHLIPILRLATEGDYFNTQVWRKPTDDDVLDFANFLNSLNWPVKNRYVSIFNEVNRSDEWGGALDPSEYAEILSYAVSIFKARSDDFFIISAGLDNAAPNEPGQYMNEYTFMRQMDEAVPGIFGQIDGLASHSYPNPGFSEPPDVLTDKSIASFIYERRLAKTLSGKDLPVFITETGWTSDGISDDQRAQYYQTAMNTVWQDQGIVAITPFLLRASGNFNNFTFINDNGEETKQYEAMKDEPKTKGAPTVLSTILQNPLVETLKLPEKNFQVVHDEKENKVSLSLALQQTFKWIMKLN